MQDSSLHIRFYNRTQTRRIRRWIDRFSFVEQGMHYKFYTHEKTTSRKLFIKCFVNKCVCLKEFDIKLKQIFLKIYSSKCFCHEKRFLPFSIKLLNSRDRFVTDLINHVNRKQIFILVITYIKYYCWLELLS